MSLSIYILRLQGGKYYIGKTVDVVKRYQEHLSGHGAQWTRKYRPISLERTIPNASPFDEDKYVKEYMAKYGIDKVRGGSYVSEQLDEIQEEALKREIWGAQDKCTRCGHKGHFVKDCYAKIDVDGNEMFSEDEEIIFELPRPNPKLQSKSYQNTFHTLSKETRCFSCGKTGHYASNCYSRQSSRQHSRR